MRKIEELCIKYLMNETDPSETAQIRSEIINDSDALIEYESMKATLNRLDDLPKLTPPNHITLAVLETAKNMGKKRSKIYFLGSKKWLVAAGIGFIAITGIIGSISYLTDINLISSNSESSTEKHWVDKNDIITLSPGIQPPVLSSENSNKLKPVLSSPQQDVKNTDIKLAGSKQVVINP